MATESRRRDKIARSSSEKRNTSTAISQRVRSTFPEVLSAAPDVSMHSKKGEREKLWSLVVFIKPGLTLNAKVFSFSRSVGGHSSMVEPQIVVLDVAGSSPVGHPTAWISNLESDFKFPLRP